MKILLICGSRDWTGVKVIHDYITQAAEIHGQDLIVMHGGCKTGADNIADKLCRALGVTQMIVPAEFERYGTAGGPIRNQRMVDQYKPYRCIAFKIASDDLKDNRGTRSMISKAQAAYIPVTVVEG